MNHKTINTFVILFLLLPLGSCAFLKKTFTGSDTSSKKSQPGYTRHSDVINGFSIEFPKSWEVDEKPSREGIKDFFSIIFNAKSPLENNEDTYQETIGVVIFDPIKFKEYAERNPEVMEKKKTDVTKILSSGMVTISGLSASWNISKSYTSEDKKHQLKQMGYNIQYGAKLIKIGWVGETDKFQEFRPIIDRVVFSINFE